MNRESISKMAAAMQQVAENQKKTEQRVTSAGQTVDKPIQHDCATHVEHAQWGEGYPISGQHTIVETSEGHGYVTHYDVKFDHGIEENVSVKDLKILAESSHGHARKKKSEETVKEAKFEIPETIDATERTAFHGAAAAAHGAGKSHFSFQGKKYPVTMRKDAAKAIADQKEGTDEGYSSMVSKATRDRIKKSVAQNKPPVVNPKYKATQSADRKKAIADDVNESKKAALAKKLAKASASSEKGKAAVTLPKAPFDIPKATKNEEDEVVVNPKKETKKAKTSDEVSAVESTAWPVYKRIMEKRGEHYKSATPVQEPNDASKSSKGAQDMLNTPKDVKGNPEASGDDVKKAANAGPGMKARPNDGKTGDKKIIPSATKA